MTFSLTEKVENKFEEIKSNKRINSLGKFLKEKKKKKRKQEGLSQGKCDVRLKIKTNKEEK